MPRKIYVYDKKEFVSWSCEEGSALNIKKNSGFDAIKEDKWYFMILIWNW